MMKGLPASGKSTKAKELVDLDGAVRVNRDLLREMMNFTKFKHEDMVVDTEKFVVRGFLGQGIDVVVDDCNLNPANEDMWRSIAKEYDAEFHVLDVPTDMYTCILHDIGREKKVGHQVIRQMALQYGRHMIKAPVVICDIDGTIADITHRLKYAKGEDKDWKKFFSNFDKDLLRTEVYAKLIEHEIEGCEIIFVSARPEDYRKETALWLADNVDAVDSGWLLMRPSNDKRDDTIVKRNIYDKYLKNLNIIKVYDDRPKVIRMWRELGLDVVDVGNGVEF